MTDRELLDHVAEFDPVHAGHACPRPDRGVGGAALDGRAQWMTPFGFPDPDRRRMRALRAISDGGPFAGETAIPGVPARTPRDAIERSEGLDVGCLPMTGLDGDAILRAAKPSGARDGIRRDDGG